MHAWNCSHILFFLQTFNISSSVRTCVRSINCIVQNKSKLFTHLIVSCVFLSFFWCSRSSSSSSNSSDLMFFELHCFNCRLSMCFCCKTHTGTHTHIQRIYAWSRDSRQFSRLYRVHCSQNIVLNETKNAQKYVAFFLYSYVNLWVVQFFVFHA